MSMLSAILEKFGLREAAAKPAAARPAAEKQKSAGPAASSDTQAATQPAPAVKRQKSADQDDDGPAGSPPRATTQPAQPVKPAANQKPPQAATPRPKTAAAGQPKQSSAGPANVAPAAPQAGSPMAGQKPVAPASPPVQTPPPAAAVEPAPVVEHPAAVEPQAEAELQAEAVSVVDVVSDLENRAARHPEKLNWKVSIVDLLKLLGLESSFDARKQLAVELGCPPEAMGDSVKMNTWLHKTVLSRIAENGGNIPKELFD
jgi:hypothetical protein